MPGHALRRARRSVKMRLPLPDANVVRPRFTYPFNFSNSPTLTLPCGFTTEDVPIALQLVGPHFSEATLLRVGHAYEQANGVAYARTAGVNRRRTTVVQVSWPSGH